MLDSSLTPTLSRLLAPFSEALTSPLATFDLSTHLTFLLVFLRDNDSPVPELELPVVPPPGRGEGSAGIISQPYASLSPNWPLRITRDVPSDLVTSLRLPVAIVNRVSVSDLRFYPRCVHEIGFNLSLTSRTYSISLSTYSAN